MPSRSAYLTGLFALLLMAMGCENDIERINMFSSEEHMPTLSGEEIEIIYTDSARLKVRLEAPAYKQFSTGEKPYMEFPGGLHVFFYNDSADLQSEITADHCIYHMDDKLWHATGNVVASKFETGEALHTEELFWNEEKEQIYSNSYTRVEQGENVMYGNRGFKSHQSMDNWQLIGSSGNMSIEDYD